jgi:hypothetical protein
MGKVLRTGPCMARAEVAGAVKIHTATNNCR